jgi:hypothetical protein
MDKMGLEKLERILSEYLPDNERGGLLLTADDGGMFFASEIEPDQLHFYFQYIPSNYPAIHMGVKASDANSLREMVRHDFAGWTVVKDNFNIPTDSVGDVLELEEA